MGVLLPAFVGAVEANEGVMHRLARRAQFDSPHLARGLRRHGYDKVPVHVPAFGRQGVGLGHPKTMGAMSLLKVTVPRGRAV